MVSPRSATVAAAAMLATACTGIGEGGLGVTQPLPHDCTAYVSTATLEPSNATVEVGRGVWFNRSASGQGGGAGCYIIDSLTVSDTNLAGVTYWGTVVGRAPGVVTVTYRAGGASATATVTVQPVRSTFVAVTGGGYSDICVLSSDGDAYCIPTLLHSAPEKVWGDVKFSALDMGPNRMCGLAPGGLAYCWGFAPPGGSFGGPLWLPSPIRELADVVAIDAGGNDHLCALTAGGDAYCWGSNAMGQLGNASVPRDGNSAVPLAVSGGLGLVAVALGNTHSCGLTADGSAFCWGDNSQGQLGTDSSTATCGTAGKRCQLVPIRAAAGQTFVSLVAGGSHTCGLTADGRAFCWGANGSGQLGTGDTIPGSAARSVTGDLRFSALSAGEARTCGLTVSGDAYCWGLNYGAEQPSRAPRLVPGGMHFSSLAVGRYATCGVANSITYCWGATGDSIPVRVPGQAS